MDKNRQHPTYPPTIAVKFRTRSVNRPPNTFVNLTEGLEEVVSVDANENHVNDVTSRGSKSNRHSLQEIALRMRRMNAPPIVDEHVERAQDQDKESGRPLGLEPYRNHTARPQAYDRHQHSPDPPLSLNDEPQKEEDEQDATGEKEVFLSVIFADGRKSGERSSSGDHRVAEDHEQSTDHTQVAQEEIKVENQAITQSLRDDNSEKSPNSKFGVLLRDHRTRAGKHRGDVEKQEHM